MQSLFYGTAEENENTSNPSFSGGAQPQQQQQTNNSSSAFGNYSGAKPQQQTNVFGGSGGTSANNVPQAPSTGGSGNQAQINGLFGMGGNVGAQDVGWHVANASSVKEYAYTEDKNRAYRPDMEDTHCHLDKVAGDPQCGLFAVFDGHGGKQVAEHCAETFPLLFKKEVQKSPQDLYQPLELVFNTLDKQLEMLDSDHCGATACVAVVRKEGNHNFVYVANAGDTRAVLSKNGAAERLSKDHKASDPQEIERIKSLGGKIMDGRVAGGLAITRALGDMAYKSFGVTSQPYVVRHVLRPFDKYLIIASDGVWDTVTDDQAVALCKDDQTTKQSAQAIVKLAIEKGSADNIACMVIKFNSGAIF